MNTQLLEGLTAPTWMAAALCAQVDPELFFPENTPDRVGNNSPADAKRVCAACPVMQECRAYAIADDTINYGIWGGLSVRERQQQRTHQPRTRCLSGRHPWIPGAERCRACHLEATARSEQRRAS